MAQNGKQMAAASGGAKGRRRNSVLPAPAPAAPASEHELGKCQAEFRSPKLRSATTSSDYSLDNQSDLAFKFSPGCGYIELEHRRPISTNSSSQFRGDRRRMFSPSTIQEAGSSLYGRCSITVILRLNWMTCRQLELPSEYACRNNDRRQPHGAGEPSPRSEAWYFLLEHIDVVGVPDGGKPTERRSLGRACRKDPSRVFRGEPKGGNNFIGHPGCGSLQSLLRSQSRVWATCCRSFSIPTSRTRAAPILPSSMRLRPWHRRRRWEKY